MSTYIITFTKQKINPLEPDIDKICIEDIAHALSLMTRANGHFPIFYSVGQHCLACCEEAKARGYDTATTLACLLHDAGEAYMADITRPVKQYLPFYMEAEDNLLAIIFEKFLGAKLTSEQAKKVKDVDNTLLYHEFKTIMGESCQVEPGELQSAPLFSTRPFAAVEKEYLECFYRLTAELT